MSEDKLTLLLGANATVTLSWKQWSFTIPKILEPLRIMLHLPCLCSVNGATKPEFQHLCFQHGLLNILSLLLRSTQKKRFLSKYYSCLIIHCGLPRALMEMYNEITVVFISASTTSILQPKGQGVISILKSYSLTYTFCKALHHRCSFLMDLGKSTENLLERTHHSRFH